MKNENESLEWGWMLDIARDYCKENGIKKSVKDIKSFKTITSAVKELDETYGREHWTKVGFVDTIIINGVYTHVSYGLRMDPSTDKEYKYFRTLQNNQKYSFANIRLS